PHYDPMIAKLIARGNSRHDAIGRLSTILCRVEIWPVKTNVQFLLRCIHDGDFREAKLDTGLIARNYDELTAPVERSECELIVAALNLLSEQTRDEISYPLLDANGIRDYRVSITSQLNPLFGFRLNSEPDRLVRLRVYDEPAEVRVVVPAISADEVDYSKHSPRWSRLVGNTSHRYALAPLNERGTGHTSAADGAIIAPMPGKVIAVDVSESQTVTAGQRLMVLEAMKMEHALTAPFDGTVTELNASEGEQVQVEAVLAVVEPSGED
ncbi:MAG: biotin/lipoyl-containing protein, partial [Erythrobacter sp.]